MNVVVYQQPTGTALGGSEVVAACMAAALRDRHRVTLVHHKPTLLREELAAFAEVDLEGVELRFVPAPPPGSWFPHSARPWAIGRGFRAWKAEVSRGADLFVASTHEPPPFHSANAGLLYILFPFVDRRRVWPWSAPRRGGLAGWKDAIRLRTYDRLWHDRFANYHVRLADSQFSADWTQTYWGISSDVLYPPIVTAFPERPRTNRIAAVGRFDPMKQQLEMVRVFASQITQQIPDWELVLAGTVGKGQAEQEYFREVSAAAAGLRVRLLTDASRADVRELLATAKVFWHAAGFGVDRQTEPHRLEHFGMSTAEAMAAGCVPVVPNRGGQPEIVRHGEDGFVCESVEELASYTAKLAPDEPARERMSASARERAEMFSRERFLERFTAHVRNLSGG